MSRRCVTATLGPVWRAGRYAASVVPALVHLALGPEDLLRWWER